MRDKWPKFIRDPIHGLIRFDDRPVDHLLFDLIHCKEFQRLRRIKQLGFSDMIFPGATYTRFAHSIGVLHNARRFLDRIERCTGARIDSEWRDVVEVAALLHDIGHGPFSHAFERVTDKKHEWYTVAILLDQSTEIGSRLAEFETGGSFACRVATLFPEGVGLLEEKCTDTPPCPYYLASIVSSQFDADRADYLLRDSHFSGTEYGRFDLDRLVEHLFCDKNEDVLYFSNKAMHEIEQYVFARYHMYQAVYFHKATRAAEVMLRLVFGRLKELEGDGRLEEPDFLACAEPALVKAFQGNMEVADYLMLDDNSVIGLLKRLERSQDHTLQHLSRGLLHRRLYKCCDASDVEQYMCGTFCDKVQEFLDENRTMLPVGKKYAFEQDKAANVPYKIVLPDDEEGKPLLVAHHLGPPVGIHRVSDVVEILSKKITTLRYCYPAEIRDDIDQIAKGTLRRTSG